MTPPAVYIDQDLIDEVSLRPEFAAFFERVLGRSVRDCLLTDDSTLSDFSGGGVGAPSFEGLSYHQYLDAWDAWVLSRLQSEFGVVLTSTNIRLVALADLLRRPVPSTH